MIDTSRYFENKFPDNNNDDQQQQQIIDTNKNLCGKIKHDILSFLSNQFQYLNDMYKTSIEKGKFDSKHDTSVYTGTSGVMLLAQQVAKSTNAEWNASLAFHKVLMKKLTWQKRRITFLCGDIGPLIVLVKQCKSVGDEEGASKHAKEILNYADWSQKEPHMDNEVLYGRAGYLYALLLLRQIDEKLVPEAVVKQLVDDIIKAGVKGATTNTLPLYFEWHEKEYIGAAHGYIGIMYMLLQAKVLCPGVLQGDDESLVVQCLEGLLHQRFTSGNMRSSVGSESDRLIHWCHGSPGAIHLYALAYKLYQKPAYMSACVGFADVVWGRGLLRKGYGICHGVAGNGYALLCMYQLTGKEEYLWKAVKFAEWCLAYGDHGCRTPDRPLSLFEGLSGTLHYLHDILAPDQAMFPAFQLVPYIGSG